MENRSVVFGMCIVVHLIRTEHIDYEDITCDKLLSLFNSTLTCSQTLVNRCFYSKN